MPTETHHLVCPAWCTLAHVANTTAAHEGTTSCMHLSLLDDDRHSLQVRTVQYPLLDWEQQASTWMPFVEVAHYTGRRYRLINMTSEEARRLAALILECAEQADEVAGDLVRGAALRPT